jgi:hypothetical protein
MAERRTSRHGLSELAWKFLNDQAEDDGSLEYWALQYNQFDHEAKHSTESLWRQHVMRSPPTGSSATLAPVPCAGGVTRRAWSDATIRDLRIGPC